MKRSSQRIVLSVIIAWGIAGTARAAEPPSAFAARFDLPPRLDGSLSDPQWQRAAPIGPFSLASGNTRPTQLTDVKVGWDSGALYFGFVCHEDQMNKLAAAVTDRDGNVFADDCIEIFLGPRHDRFNYFHFAVSASGARWDADGDGAGVSPEWDAPWDAVVKRGADAWTAEVRIPFAMLRLGRGTGPVWDFNVTREEKPHGELSTWAPVGPRFAAPQNFGLLTGIAADFSPYFLSFDFAGMPPARQGKGVLRLRVRNEGSQPRTLQPALSVSPPSEAPRNSQGTDVTIAPGAAADIALDYGIFEQGLNRLTASLTDNGRVVAAREVNLLVKQVAEYSGFTSFYRDHTTVLCELNIDPVQLKQLTLTAQLVDAKGAAIGSPRTIRPKTSRFEMRFDTAKLATGDYKIQLHLTGAGHDDRQAVSFVKLRNEPADKLAVWIDDNNRLHVGGKPFFPIGIYAGPSTTASVRELKEAGFNLVRTDLAPASVMQMALRHYAAAGLKVWVVLSHALDLSTDREAKEKQLRDAVQAVAGNPALLVWESIDEPAWGSQNADGLYEGYRFLKRLDPNHPVWTNHAPRNLISTLAYYNRATDIAGCDIYPVPEPQSQSNLPNKTISIVGDETAKNCAAVNGEKPVFMVLQGFAWKTLFDPAATDAVYPTLQQSRFMAYDAILNGAKGILYWGVHAMPKPSRPWAELKMMANELSKLQEVFVAPASKSARVSGPPTVKATVRTVGKDTFLIAVNAGTREAKAEVRGLPRGVRRFFTIFSGSRRQLKVVSGRTTLEIPAYTAVIATSRVNFNDSRPDYSKELQHPSTPVTAAALRTPGSALLNGSFEFAAADPGVPDRWQSRYPFSAVVDSTVAHDGKCSLKFTSPAADFMPLLIQTGVPLDDNATYELSGWIRGEGDIQCRLYCEWVLGGQFHSKVGPWEPVSADWRRITYRFQATPPPGSSAYVVVQTKGKGTAWFDDVRLEKR